MISKRGEALTDLAGWGRLAGPKAAIHWQDGRSAMECAKAWVGATPAIPPELQGVIAGHADFSALRSWSGEPEARVKFDSYPGEPANLDLLVVARDELGIFVMGIEAKADEPFGATVDQTRQATQRRLESNPRSKGADRLTELTAAILGPSVGSREAGRIRYQLLTASAAVLAEAERRAAGRAILMIHEFVTDRTTDDRHASNAADLGEFVRLLSGGPEQEVREGQLVGPLRVHGAPLFPAPPPFYVGKAIRRLRTTN